VVYWKLLDGQEEDRQQRHVCFRLQDGRTWDGFGAGVSLTVTHASPQTGPRGMPPFPAPFHLMAVVSFPTHQHTAPTAPSSNGLPVQPMRHAPCPHTSPPRFHLSSASLLAHTRQVQTLYGRHALLGGGAPPVHFPTTPTLGDFSPHTFCPWPPHCTWVEHDDQVLDGLLIVYISYSCWTGA